MLPILRQLLKDFEELGRRNRNSNRQNQRNHRESQKKPSQPVQQQAPKKRQEKKSFFFTTPPNAVKDIFFPGSSPDTPTYFKVSEHLRTLDELQNTD